MKHIYNSKKGTIYRCDLCELRSQLTIHFVHGDNMKGTIELKVDFPTEKAAKDAKTALEKETNKNKRFSSTITLKEKQLVISVDGKDIVALRATTNSFLRYLQVIEQLLQT